MNAKAGRKLAELKEVRMASLRLRSKNRDDASVVIDAIGREVCAATDYVWTETSLDASFKAAFGSGWIPDTMYLGLRTVPGRRGLHAIAYHGPTGELRTYAMNPGSARPYLIDIGLRAKG